MKIWKLSPLDIDFAGWCFSIHKGDAIVRAEDEEEARNIATQHFRIAAKKVPGQETPLNPWNYSTVVKCIELDNSKYSTDDPAGLLEPEGFDI